MGSLCSVGAASLLILIFKGVGRKSCFFTPNKSDCLDIYGKYLKSFRDMGGGGDNIIVEFDESKLRKTNITKKNLLKVSGL